MKTIILCTLLFSIGLKGICQSDNALKYLSALVYLKANQSINESIAKTYPMWFKKNHTCIDFKISKTVRFISLKEFKDSKEIKEYVADSVLIDGIKLRGKSFFYPYTSNFLQRVEEEAEPNNAKIYLTFSNPVNNVGKHC